MRSKPPIHVVSANQIVNAGGSNWPRTAIQPPAPAMPSVKPSTQCESHGDVGEGQGEDGVLELDRVEHARDLAQSPYSFQRRVTRSRISSVIVISSGQGCATSSSALFSVASTPSLPP